MIRVEQSSVGLQKSVASKKEAIQLAADILAQNGVVKSNYAKSMLHREEIANTYIGNGIAIPHGLSHDGDLIYKTGISIVQIPKGVEWNLKETVYIVVGIAAKSDEHIEILKHITHLLDDEAALETLKTTISKDTIIEIITGLKPQPNNKPNDIHKYNHKNNCTVPGSVGLHGRPASLIAEAAKKFSSKILVEYNGNFANGKSLSALLKLGAKAKDTLTIYTSGEDAKIALATIVSLVENGLGEKEAEEVKKEQTFLTHKFFCREAKCIIQGLPASQGIAIGRLTHYQKPKVTFERFAQDFNAEHQKLLAAINQSKMELKNLYTQTKETMGENTATVFHVHLELLEDPETLSLATNNIEQGNTAAWSWSQAMESSVSALKNLDNQLVAQRAIDLHDVKNRVLQHLTKKAKDNTSFSKASVLVASDFIPSDIATFDPSVVFGLCMVAGSPTSHAAIVARSLNIPTIVACNSLLLEQEEGKPVILDGSKGILYVEPSQEDIDAAFKAKEWLQESLEIQLKNKNKPVITTDGHSIEVGANIGYVADGQRALDNGADGIGLMRTEFLFLGKHSPPTEEEQYQAYSSIAKTMNGKPLIIRTLDIGGDKNVSYFNIPQEENPFLGLRGIRFTLAHKNIFKTQLRAIYQATKFTSIKIMFPMIATVEEFLEAKAICLEIQKELQVEEAELGLMIEVPSAVMLAEELAKHADFFSIGTNDLTQYVFAMDRLHPQLAKKAEDLHPAVLRMIDKVVGAAIEQKIWVGVCGSIASTPLGAILMMGLGVKELSVSIPDIPKIKNILRSISFEQAVDLSAKALRCTNAKEVHELISEKAQ